MENMRFKVGDRVRIKSIDWYNENKDEFGNVDINYDFTFYADRSKYCGKVFTISKVYDNSYFVKEDNESYYWTDEMIEGLVEEETEKKLSDESWNVFDYSQYPQSFELPKGYQFVDENGNVINDTKIVLEKKKKKYPKTYEECCNVLSLGEDSKLYTKGYKANLIQNFQKLLIARDAYWKIAGEEMGLGKPWKPDWREERYVIYRNQGDIIGGYRTAGHVEHNIFEFPIKEMRDAFKKNFDPDIEFCKELL